MFFWEFLFYLIFLKYNEFVFFSIFCYCIFIVIKVMVLLTFMFFISFMGSKVVFVWVFFYSYSDLFGIWYLMGIEEIVVE